MVFQAASCRTMARFQQRFSVLMFSLKKFFAPAQNAHSWAAVVVLAVAAFVFSTTEFVPVGLLPDIAADFGMDVAHTGLMMTVYAWTVTLLSLPLTMAAARCDRRILLAVLFAVFVAAHIFAAFSGSFNALLAVRIAVAAVHSVFWAITVPMAVRLAPEGQRAKAMGLIVTGSSLAAVMGIPLGTLIGHQFGWRVTFALIGAAAMGLLLMLLRLLPVMPPQGVFSLRGLPALFKRPLLLYVYFTLALVVGAHFIPYTYISPFLAEVGGLDGGEIVVSLFAFGIAGISAGIIFARNLDRHSVVLLTVPMVLLFLSLLLLPWLSGSLKTVFPLIWLWGTSITLLGMVLQNKVLEIAPEASDIAVAAFSGVYNIGIGAGALLGAQITAAAGVVATAYGGALSAAVPVVLFVFIGRKLWQK